MVSPPPEVLARIFFYLEPSDLDTVPLVCKSWQENSGEKLWRRHFAARFGTLDVTALSGPDFSWREEYLIREEILGRWTRQNLKTVSYNATLGTITDMFSDLSGSRVITFNRGRGVGNISDPRVGKVARERMFAADFSIQHRIACLDGSRFAIVCGFHDGRIITMVFARSSHLILSYNFLQYRHDDAVTAVWVSKTHRPNVSSDTLSFVTGGADGKVFLVFGARTDNYKQVDLSQHPIDFVWADTHSGQVVAADSSGRLFWLNKQGETVASSKLPSPLSQDDTQLFICCGFVIAKYRDTIYRASPHGYESYAMSGEQERILAWNFDRAATTGPKYMVAAVSSGTIYCWRVDHPVLDDPVPLFWARPSPLTSERQPHITQVALNSVVLLIGGYNGHCVAMDLMSGETLRQVSSKLSRQVLDFRRGDTAGRESFPISHLQVDPDPLQPHAILSVKEAIQYIDSGADNERIKPLRKNRKPAVTRLAAERQTAADIHEEIDFNMEMITLEDEEHNHQTHLREAYNMTDMTEEEQIAYAVLLSEQNEDAELIQALELSLHPEEPPQADESDEELREILERSLVDQ
ncbi:F-box/WD repeat-containing protein pof10 [Wickerhamiella sorbophila]|uniref:F-box/WD repeat-containing protein pof10 n=1 Tax=Wickerhamiella sorbophila TaxID=45607 RepID=A0A2T0FIJ2_9ASCO|nr:F-box/WD repeat-containing protein pof10 [Wickerhamiella sorbophila]PRT54777.1 F-box/WD repeat-containing protein pof10 [Wickerhamiella sorbophila]